MKKPYPPTKKATSFVKEGKPKKLTEYGGLEKYTSKSAMMKSEKAESKKKEMSEGKPKPSKTTAKKPAMKFESKVVPKSKTAKPAMEEVKGLTLKRANEIERRPTQEKLNSVYAKYKKEGGYATYPKSMKNPMTTKKMVATAKEIRSKDNDIVGKNLEKNLYQSGKYKVPAKSTAKKKIKR